MRIAHLCQSYPPMVSGAAIMVQRLAEGTAARGHRSLVLCASDRDRAHVSESDGLRLVRFSSLPNPARVGQRFLLWPPPQIVSELKRFRPTVIHLHEPLLLGLAGLGVARALKVPAVLTTHQLPWFAAAYAPPALRQSLESILWAYSRWLLRQCAAVITPSQFIAEVVRAQTGCSPEVISYGLDLQRFSPAPIFPGEGAALRQKYGLHPSLPVILHVGRIDVEKKVDVVVRAAARTLARVPAQLLVVGDGTRRRALMKLSRELGISDRCRFPGFVDNRTDLPGLYRLASVFATACEIETQGIVLLEAAASGLPAVVARAGALPELVSEGRNGYLVPPGDAAAMGDRLADLLATPALAQSMGRASRETAMRHSFEATLEEHERLYGETLATRVPVWEAARA